MENKYRVFLYKPGSVSVTADNATEYFLGELLVDNLDVSIKLQDISTVSFTLPRKINNIDNTRIDELLDGYVIELWYGDLNGTVDVDYYRYRFTIYSTPLNFSDNKFIHSYTGYSLEALTELKMLIGWSGIEISDFFRKISYNNTEVTPRFLEPKDTVTGGNFEYTITTSGSGADYITVVPTTAVATDIDIFIYEVRQRLSSGSVVSESEAGLIPYSGSSQDDAEFKNGNYFLTISGGYVTQIHIALPENYIDFNGESVNDQILFFKLYDNPLSRRYAIGITTNAEQANDMYIDLAHDIATGAPTDFDDFNFQTQKFYSKNGLTLKQVLLGKENTATSTITEDGILYNTGFTLGTIESSLLNLYRSNLEFNNVTRYQAIKTLAESFDSIAIYDTINNTVSFYPENIYGINNGLIIRYGAYLKSLNKEIDASKIITNAIGLGKDNLTISLVNPTGLNYWEDYSYYLDDYYISSPSQIGTITEDEDLGITFDYVSTSGYQSRWMSAPLAAKIAKWQYTRDWFHSILTGEYDASGFSSDITQFYNLYEERLEAIRLLIKKETEYFTSLKREVKFQAFKNYYDKLSKDNPENTLYEEKLDYYTTEFNNAVTQNAALLLVLDAERDAIFDKDTAGSFAAKMVILQSFLQKDSVERDIDLDFLRPFQRETVVNDNTIDEEKDLLEIVKTHVDENKEPKVTISIDVADILAADEAQQDWNKVKIGDKINIYLAELNVDVVAQIREINVNFEEHSLSFVISTVRNYNKGFGNFVLKTIRNLYNSNNNNVQYELDGTRYSRSTSENVNDVLQNGIDTNSTTVKSGLTDDNGNNGTKTSGSGTTIASIAEIDPLTETVTSYNSSAVEGVIIADGKVLAYHNYTSPSTYTSEVEISADTGFTIRKISGGTVTKQVYIDTDGNAVFAGSLEVGSDAYNQVVNLAGSGTTVFKAGNTSELDAITTQNLNDLLLITASFTHTTPDPDVEYVKDDIYRYDLVTPPSTYAWVLAADLKTKISGSVAGWTINGTDIKANNDSMTLHSDSDNAGVEPYLSIAQGTEGYEEEGIFLGIESSNPKFSMVTDSGNTYLKYDPSATYDLQVEGNAKIGPLFIGNTSASTGTITDVETGDTLSITAPTAATRTRTYTFSPSGKRNVTSFSISYVNGINVETALRVFLYYDTSLIETYSYTLPATTTSVINQSVNFIATKAVIELRHFGGGSGAVSISSATFTENLATLSVGDLAVYATGNIFTNKYQTTKISINENEISSYGQSLLVTADSLEINGTDGASRDGIRLSGSSTVGSNTRRITLTTPISALAANRTIRLPDADGILIVPSSTSQGGILYASSSTGYQSTAAGATGQVLISAGTSAPTWNYVLQDISNFSGAVVSNGATAVTIDLDETLVTSALYAIEVNANTTDSAEGRTIHFFECPAASDTVTFFQNDHANASGSTTIYKFELFNSAGTLQIDDAYQHAIGTSINPSSGIRVWRVYRVKSHGG